MPFPQYHFKQCRERNLALFRSARLQELKAAASSQPVTNTSLWLLYSLPSKNSSRVSSTSLARLLYPDCFAIYRFDQVVSEIDYCEENRLRDCHKPKPRRNVHG